MPTNDIIGHASFPFTGSSAGFGSVIVSTIPIPKHDYRQVADRFGGARLVDDLLFTSCNADANQAFASALPLLNRHIGIVYISILLPSKISSLSGASLGLSVAVACSGYICPNVALTGYIAYLDDHPCVPIHGVDCTKRKLDDFLLHGAQDQITQLIVPLDQSASAPDERIPPQIIACLSSFSKCISNQNVVGRFEQVYVASSLAEVLMLLRQYGPR
jgi:hypothetical protein